MMAQLQSNNAYPQYSSVNEYLMGALPNLVSTGGYTPSNQTMSFGLNQPKSFVPLNPMQFDGSMNLVGETKPFNWQPPVPPTGGIALTDKINAGVGVFNSALGALSAYKAYQLGKDNLNFQKDAFAKNYEVQKNLTNSELEARQGRLTRGRPDIHGSVSDYMAQYGVK